MGELGIVMVLSRRMKIRLLWQAIDKQRSESSD